ncbi:MAG: phosphoenolpyruvate carboxylase [Candidatus Sumerlaeaceae bacterium]
MPVDKVKTASSETTAEAADANFVSNPGFLGIEPLQYGVPVALADDIALVDRLLGQVLAIEREDDVSSIARELYQEALKQSPDIGHGSDEHLPKQPGGTTKESPAPSGANLIERYPALKSPQIMRKVLRAFTVFFQMVNVVEQKEIVRANRQRQAARSTLRPESIAQAVAKLKADGKTATQVQEMLDRVEICPTITAHPTEARRRSVMDKLMNIADALSERALPSDAGRLESPLDLPGGAADQRVLRELVALWNTDELRGRRVTVNDEVNNSVYFFQRTIFDVVAWLHDDLRHALTDAFPGHTFRIGPFLRYHSWVGGDRDGNPNVTPEITWSTLLYHKRVILGNYLVRVDELRRELSLSSRLLPISDELQESLQSDARIISLSSDELERFELQPYAHKLTYIEYRLRATLRHLDGLADFRDEASSFLAQPPAYARDEEFVADLELLRSSMLKGRASLLGMEGDLPHLIVQARTFGFHLASLDVRQHSREHAKVLDELFTAAGVFAPGDTPYSELPEDEKLAVLAKELRSPRPLLPRDWAGSESARLALEVFQVIRHARRYLSDRSVNCYIISMTHDVSDMLEVLVLAKEAGLVRWRTAAASGTPQQGTNTEAMVLESDLDIVPLFETIEDLQHCDQLLNELFEDSTFQLHLRARNNFQELMLGYSDSSKDGGYLAANWNLQDTQDRLAAACRAANVDFRIFHGRGGTVGRGGGRASRAILSQPRGSFTGRIRFTEQGEVVSFRYGLRPMAHRHLEQIVNSVLLALAEGGSDVGQARSHDLYGPAMAEMAAHSRTVYRNMVHEDPEFWDFYTRATPIAHISRLPITSRPAMRGGGKLSGLEELRAIPWVFAWVQARYVVPGWYGLGAGLEDFAKRDPKNVETLRAMYRDWPFFRTVVDNAQLELVRTNLSTAERYAARVEPAELGQRFHTDIVNEYQRSCRWVLEITQQKRLLDNSPIVQRTVQLRNPAVLPLNMLQVALMQLWEAQPPEEAGPKSPWHEAILLSITGIAAGMQSTG